MKRRRSYINRRTAWGAVALLSLLFCIGSAGAVDFGNISMTQGAIQGGAFLALFIFGAWKAGAFYGQTQDDEKAFPPAEAEQEGESSQNLENRKVDR